MVRGSKAEELVGGRFCSKLTRGFWREGIQNYREFLSLNLGRSELGIGMELAGRIEGRHVVVVVRDKEGRSTRWQEVQELINEERHQTAGASHRRSA